MDAAILDQGDDLVMGHVRAVQVLDVRATGGIDDVPARQLDRLLDNCRVERPLSAAPCGSGWLASYSPRVFEPLYSATGKGPTPVQHGQLRLLDGLVVRLHCAAHRGVQVLV